MVNKVVSTSLFAELLLLCEWKKYIHSTQTCSELEADNNAIQSQEQILVAHGLGRFSNLLLKVSNPVVKRKQSLMAPKEK